MNDRAWGALPALFIAFFNWVYAIFVLNRFRGIAEISNPELAAFLLFVLGGFATWIAEMCILEDELTALQFVSSSYRTVVNWLGFVLVVNERLYITRQQFGSLAITLVISLLWELQHRVVL